MQARIQTTIAAIALLAASSAGAEKAKLHLARADVSQYPLLKLYLDFVDGDGRVVTGKGRDDFKLIFDSNEQGAAADAKTIDQTGEPVYLVVVAQASSAMHEVFDDEKKGVKQLVQAAGDLKGSKVALIAYAQESKRLVELSGATEAAAAVDGMQEDVEGTEVHLLDAIRTAIDLLNAKGVPDEARKLVVVFSDGIDVGGAERKGFAELGRRALRANIVVDAIGYAPFEPGKLRNLAELPRQTNGTDRVCKSAQEVGAAFASVADELKKEYVVLFRSLIAGDAREHTIQVLHESAGQTVYSNNVTKICENHGPPPGESIFRRWWFWTFVVAPPALLLLVLLIGYLARAREPQPLPAPSPPPPSMEPQRTIALDVSVGSKGPTVGWIVGLGGRYADVTFKLLPQRTVIGTAGDADIRIEDPKVSRRHCEIRHDGQGYKIVDLGSTNGTILNDRRVPQGDLVDGDLLRLGTLEFKFKSIN